MGTSVASYLVGSERVLLLKTLANVAVRLQIFSKKLRKLWAFKIKELSQKVFYIENLAIALGKKWK